METFQLRRCCLRKLSGLRPLAEATLATVQWRNNEHFESHPKQCKSPMSKRTGSAFGLARMCLLTSFTSWQHLNKSLHVAKFDGKKVLRFDTGFTGGTCWCCWCKGSKGGRGDGGLAPVAVAQLSPTAKAACGN